jgi:hypothetical protein
MAELMDLGQISLLQHAHCPGTMPSVGFGRKTLSPRKGLKTRNQSGGAEINPKPYKPLRAK